MLKEIKFPKDYNLDYFYVCENYYNKINEHLKIMNGWKNDPEFKHIFTEEFTLFDALRDLLMKGLL